MRRRSKSTTRESSERATSTHSWSDMAMREKVEREMGLVAEEGKSGEWGKKKVYIDGAMGLEVDGHVHYFLIYSLYVNSITFSLSL